VLHEYARRGGIIAVCTHSNKSFIFRDYAAGGLPIPLEVYAYDGEESLRKPSPKVIFDLCEKYALEPSDILVVDDLKVGWQMARAAGVKFAAAGWSCRIPRIEEELRSISDYYLDTPTALGELIF
jgi:phosphoglycolate phosphatase/pyrophosphatase PpaX